MEDTAPEVKKTTASVEGSIGGQRGAELYTAEDLENVRKRQT